MGDTLHAVKHYQRVLERSSHDPKRMLRCIEKLYQLPVTVQLLQDTGVGRTVNALRKGEGEIALAARTVIGKWKQMVADEEEALENQHAERIENQHSPSPSSATSQHSPMYDNECVLEISHRNNSSKHEKDKKSNSSVTKIKEEQRKPTHKHSEDNNTQRRDDRIDHSLSKKRRLSNETHNKHHKSQRSTPSSDDNENESIDENGEQDSDEEDTQAELRKSESEENEYLSDRELSVSHKISSEDESDREASLSKTSHKSSSKNSSSLSSVKSKSKHSHDVNDTERHKHKHKSDNSNENSRHDSNYSKSSSRDREKSKSKSHKESRNSYSSQVEDLHLKYEKLKNRKDEVSEDVPKVSHKEHSSETVNSEKSNHSGSKSRHSSSVDSHSNHSSKHHKESSSKHRSHKSKHTDKEKSDSEKSKKSSTKHKDSHDKNAPHHNSDVKKDSKNSSDSKKKDSKNDKHKEKRSSSRDVSSVKSDSKSKTKDLTEYVPEAKKKKTYDVCDDGIDGGSGASFAEALGMISPSKSSLSLKKKPYSNVKVSPEFHGEASHKKQSSNDEGTPTLLQSSTKLAPLTHLTVSVSALPDISPNYVPRPPPKLIESPFPSISEEEALKVVMNSKNQRTKVFSGNKAIHGHIPSLYDLCVFVLQEHINDLEYTGGIPYEIIKPIVDKASPDQLSTLEYYNPYLIEDTGELWELHCQKKFRNKHRQEMESWRDMYMRCSEEQEAKLKSLTANIKLSQDKSLPVRTTKMAYVDSIVKPPRNIARKQALHGTARKAVASPAARVPSLANSTVFNATSAVGVGASSSTQPVRTSSFVKPKKAPLMLKTLQLIKGRYKR